MPRRASPDRARGEQGSSPREAPRSGPVADAAARSVVIRLRETWSADACTLPRAPGSPRPPRAVACWTASASRLAHRSGGGSRPTAHCRGSPHLVEVRVRYLPGWAATTRVSEGVVICTGSRVQTPARWVILILPTFLSLASSFSSLLSGHSCPAASALASMSSARALDVPHPVLWTSGWLMRRA